MNAAPDWQTAVNWLAAILAAAVGWALKTLHGEVRDARLEHADLARSLPETYARRDDVRDGFKEVRDTLKRIEDKLDRKVDV